MSTTAEVRLWGSRIGAVTLADGERIAQFAYDPAFARSNIEVAPLTMPLAAERVFSFPSLNPAGFHGLPGLLADALPDKYGNTLINAWLATQGRTPDSFNAVERLCYTGTRGMGALEFSPVHGPRVRTAHKIQIDALVALATEVLSNRDNLRASFGDEERADALRDILRVGTSAGGARAKAVIAWNESTGEVRSGQAAAAPGFSYWLLKFDGVQNNRDKELADPKGYGVVEYAYALMARDAGIQISECRLLEEGGRRHFMTQRFDRTEAGGKHHMQSLAAMAHFDFNDPDAYSYEQALLVMRQLRLPMAQLEEQFRRMVFNVIARNQDDHVKNIAYLMDRQGQWSLSPAFDITWAYNPDGDWTARHQMSINGKREGFDLADLAACAATASINARRARDIIEQVRQSVLRWPHFADDAGVAGVWRDQIRGSLRTDIR
ncbi:type II toxin-antitoxin system HipA family toxin [Stenotrophomonas bentonitica]|uniref:type II toxin-antitoxin system HipA family toxin n=1 Tax=Stenotrophomonas bentonitica TaxID=1450134 RepID=UPI0037D54C85